MDFSTKSQMQINANDIQWIKEELKEINSYMKSFVFLLGGQALTFFGAIIYFLITKIS